METRGQFGQLKVLEIIDDLAALDSVVLPKSKGEKRLLQLALRSATITEPLVIYAGSCPDYSHRNGKYSHETLGEGVPLLANYHLEAASKLLKVLEKYGVPYRYVLMLADVEASDEYFQRKFANGSEDEFLRKCSRSISVTTGRIAEITSALGLKGQLISSSFYEQFGKVDFLDYQRAYQVILKQRYLDDYSFRGRIDDDMCKRLGLYRKMYPEVTRGYLGADQLEFLVDRTIRTMAQYLTLGRLIAQSYKYPMIVNHPTRNIGVFNDRNRFLLPEDGPQPQPTIPIFEIKQEVY